MMLKSKKSNHPPLPRKTLETGSPRLGRPVETSWGKVAGWYHDAVEEKGSYQKDLILPNLLRLMDIQKGERVFDLACGEGFFSRRFNRLGASVIGVDIAKELIAIAKSNREQRELTQNIANKKVEKSPGVILSDSEESKKDRSFGKPQDDNAKIEFHVAPADHIPFIKNNSVDKAVIVLALQNIESAAGVVQEVSRVLKPRGKLFIVLNHPAFRIPKASSWGFDPLAGSRPAKLGEARPVGAAGQVEKTAVQYRRIDRYLSELREKIDMHPSQIPRESASRPRLSAIVQSTTSFHRPLQFYVKALRKAGFVVANMEEWSSPKKSEPGPRAEAENRARAEFPLFLFLEAIKSQ